MSTPPRHGPTEHGVPGLLMAARNSDDRAFATLYSIHRDAVLRVARRWSGGDAQVEDLCQEAFVRLLESEVVPPDHSSLEAWLVTVTRNLAVSSHRRRTARSRACLKADVVPPVPLPLEVERRLMVAEVVATLLPPDVELIVEHYLEQRTLSEMADRRGTTRDVVKVQLHRARERARRRLRDIDLPGLGWAGTLCGRASTVTKSLFAPIASKAALAVLVPAAVLGGMLAPVVGPSQPTGMPPGVLPRVSVLASPEKALDSAGPDRHEAAAMSSSDGVSPPPAANPVVPPNSGMPPVPNPRPSWPEITVPFAGVEASHEEIRPPRNNRLVIGDEAIVAVVIGEDEPVEPAVQLGCQVDHAVPLVECERP